MSQGKGDWIAASSSPAFKASAERNGWPPESPRFRPDPAPEKKSPKDSQKGIA